jgi:uncharacterized membrane protein
MSRSSQQVPATDLTSIVSLLTALVYLLIYGVIFYLFYSVLQRIEKTLNEIKELLEGKASTAKTTLPGPRKSHRTRNVLLGIAFVLVFLIAIGAGIGALNSNVNTSTMHQAPISPCVFFPQSLAVSYDGSYSGGGCLTSGSQGNWGFAVTCTGCVRSMSGTVSSTYAINVRIFGVGPFGGVLYSKNGTTSASFSGIQLHGQTGYGIYVTNASGQNNSVSMTFQFSGF